MRSRLFNLYELATPIEDLDIELSPYQQAAVDASFQAAMQSLIGILSVEQKQQLREYLLNETSTTELSI